MRATLLILFVVTSCGNSRIETHSPPHAADVAPLDAMPRNNDGGLVVDGLGGFRCVIKDRDSLVILNIEPQIAGPLVLADAATELLRAEAQSSGLAVSSHRSYPRFEKWEIPCVGTAEGDGQCISKVGERLRTDWVVWGELYKDADRYRIDLQLVPTGRPQARRQSRLFIRERAELPAAIHRAWQQLAQEF